MLKSRRQFARNAMVAMMAAIALTGCGRKEAPAVAERPSTGERLTVATVQITDQKPVSGIVTTRDLAEARARIGGVLTQLSVREGDVIRKGQRIGLVVDERIGLETGALDAQAQALEAEAVRARSELARTRALVEKGIYAPVRLEQDQAAATAADRRLDAARAQRASAAESATQGAILAPADGRVLRAQTPAGSVVAAGQSVASIAVGAPVVRIQLPEAQARALRPGAPILVKLTADAAATEGAIVEVYPQVIGGQVSADLRLPGLDATLVGRRVEALAPVGQRPAMIIPARFVATRFGIDYVRVTGPDGRASEVPVQLASTREGETREVLSGLKAGDVILSAAGQ